MAPPKRQRQHEIAEAERVAQGLSPRLEDPSTQSRILSAMGLSMPLDTARPLDEPPEAPARASE
jgi:hypothetical protein